MNRDQQPPGPQIDGSEGNDGHCYRFERQWRDGQTPRIEDYLVGIDESQRIRLLEQLLALEIQHRRSESNTPDAAEYVTRFPDCEPLIRRVFDTTVAGTDTAAFQDAQSSTGGDDQPVEPLSTVSFVSPMQGTTLRRESTDEIGDPTLEILAGRYRLLRALGSGTFGRVYLARDEELDRLVAIKLPQPDAPLDNAALERFREEARKLAALDHPHIVPVYDWGQTDDGRCYVVAKYVDGGSLLEQIEKARSSGERTACEKAVSIVAELADALHHAHQRKLVHRDVKPANVLLDKTGRPLLADFGLALHEDQQWRLRNEVSGSPAYMAPEQVRGQAQFLDGRADIWALGVILYELLVGRRPFSGRNSRELFSEIESREPKPPRQIDDSIPVDLERAILKCLRKSIADRYSTAADLASDLRLWLRASESNSVRKPEARVSYASRIKRYALVLFAALLASALGIGFAISNAKKNAPSESNPSPSTAGPTVTSNEPLRVVSIDVALYEKINGDEAQLGGLLGKETWLAHLGDQVAIRGILSRPAYAYLLAFRPDGGVELCYPDDASLPPPKSNRASYPVAAKLEKYRYGLSDGTGLWVFAIVASDEPLPAWRDYIADSTLVWSPQDVNTSSATVWSYDGEWITPSTKHPLHPFYDLERSAGEQAQGPSADVVRAANLLQSRVPNSVTSALGFCVAPAR